MGDFNGFSHFNFSQMVAFASSMQGPAGIDENWDFPLGAQDQGLLGGVQGKGMLKNFYNCAIKTASWLGLLLLLAAGCPSNSGCGETRRQK
jgi:hypothetical protein